MKNARDSLQIWTIYGSPADYPGFYVARLFVDGKVTNRALFSCTLEGLRDKLPPGLFPIGRSPGDPPQIIETWL